MKLNRSQRRLLFESLKSAFRSRSALQRFLSFNFNINLASIANQDNLDDNIFAVINSLEGEGLIDELVEAAHREHPQNPELRALAREILPPGRVDGSGARRGQPDNGTERADLIKEWTRAFQDLEHQVCEQDEQAQFEQVFAVIRAVLLTPHSANLPPLKEVVDAALWLWDKLYEQVRESVVRSLRWADQSGGREWISKRFRAGSTKERRLLRDPRLREIAPDLEQHWYNWPPLQTQPPLDDNPDIKRWLERHDLSANPFGPRIVDIDPLLIASRAFPKQWDFIVARRSCAVSTSDDYDRAAAALILQNELQSAVPQTAFLVSQRLPLPGMGRNKTLADGIRAVARAVGETWITFLSLNPSALLDLSKPDRMTLVELLLWTTGSLPTLRRQLAQYGLRDDSEGKAVLQQLDDMIGPQSHPSKPSSEKLISWLRIRPPGLGHTYFIVDCPADLPHPDGWDQMTRLSSLSSVVITAGISFKIFHSPGTTHLSKTIDQVQLSWERERLESMLSTRIYLASEKRLQTLGELFGPEPFEEADSLLIDQAHGSLGKILELGNAVIQEHIRRYNPADHYLDPSDLTAVLQQDGSAP